MPRRGNVAKREVLADPIYNSKVVTRLVNYIMLDGKKGVAQEIVYDAFDIVKEKTGAKVEQGQTLGKAAVYQGEALLEEYEVRAAADAPRMTVRDAIGLLWQSLTVAA